MAKHERVTIPAGEVRAGDRFAIPETGARGATVTDVQVPPWGKGLEVWTDADPMGMPTNLRPEWKVEVWREVSR
jgi:hypothetical protein